MDGPEVCRVHVERPGEHIERLWVDRFHEHASTRSDLLGGQGDQVDEVLGIEMLDDLDAQEATQGTVVLLLEALDPVTELDR